MRKIAPNVHAVGALDWDARLFDRLIPLPDGTSYNAYLIKGDQKTALLDTVDPSMTDVLIDNLKALKIEKIDYLISHHAEQDHSGSIPAVLKLYPQARVVANPRCKDMLIDLLHLADDKFITVEDGRELSLGDKTLQFVYLPWVHWPETMGSYLKEEKILFSCDFFGAHLATSSLFVDDPTRLYESAKRYYAEIMMPFRQQITKNLQKLQNLPINIIAPSHGPVHNNPAFIVDAYRDWVGESVKNEVVIAYVSMHGSTAKMVSFLTEALIERGIAVKRFELSTVDIGKLAIALVDAATIIIGTPAVLTGPHPWAAYAAMLTNALRPKTRFASIIGSFGWGSKLVDDLLGALDHLKAEILEPVLAQGYPGPDAFAALEKLAREIKNRHQEMGIVK